MEAHLRQYQRTLTVRRKKLWLLLLARKMLLLSMARPVRDIFGVPKLFSRSVFADFKHVQGRARQQPWLSSYSKQ